MIVGFKDAASRRFAKTGKLKFSGLNDELAHQRLAELNSATAPRDLSALKSTGLHKLKGPLSGYWSININGPWRVAFKFKDGDAYEVHITDTH